MDCPDFGINLPSATSSNEERRLYELQMAILDTRSLWVLEDWDALMEKLRHYTTAVRAEETRKGCARGRERGSKEIENYFSYGEGADAIKATIEESLADVTKRMRGDRAGRNEAIETMRVEKGHRKKP